MGGTFHEVYNPNQVSHRERHGNCLALQVPCWMDFTYLLNTPGYITYITL